MARTTSTNLGDHFNDFVEHQVAQGRYASTSEVVRAALRLLEEHEDRQAKVAVLRAAIVAGEESGSSQPFDFHAFVKEQRGRKRV
jgi:antitoxin ParD1/3/4